MEIEKLAQKSKLTEPNMSTSKKLKTKKSRALQGPLLLWHGLRVSLVWKLLRMKPTMSWSRAHFIAGLLPSSLHNSFWGMMESLFYGRKIRQTEIKPPVFVLGHWRSGTTLLHNLLTLDDEFTFSNLYQTLFPEHFLITEGVTTWLTNSLVPVKRPMDNMKTGWKMPQEDEIATLNSSLISHYLLNTFQGRPELYDPFLDLKGVEPKVRQTWKNALERFMKKLTIRENKPIVLKSPGHTLRIPVLLEMFPDAKFIYIYRNPYAVIRSSIHVRETLVEANRLGKIDFNTIEGEILNIYKKCMTNYEIEKELIPKDNLHELRFEDLEQDPIHVLKEAYESLGLDHFAPLQTKIEAELPQLQSYQKNKFELPEEERKRWYDEVKFVFDRYGYPEYPEGMQPRNSSVVEERAS